MPCLHPIDVHNKKAHKSFLVPCGRCDECLHRKKMSYVFRCEQEKLHGSFRYCYFITLTYADKYLPYVSYSSKMQGSPVDPVSTGESLLCPYDLTQFFKRYRLLVDDKVRYFCCGEYGSSENTHRPHYHIVFFCNQNWKDCVKFSQLAWSYLVAESVSDRKKRYKLSKQLGTPIKRDSQNMCNRELIGRVQVKSVTYKRICYVAKYCNKILFSDEIVKPFMRLSNGLGESFLGTDSCVLCKEQNRHNTYFENGLSVAIPRYFTHRMFTQKQMDEFTLKLILDSNPPDCFTYDVYEPMYDADFFVKREVLDMTKINAWYKAYNEQLQMNVKRSRLARYGITRYYG